MPRTDLSLALLLAGLTALGLDLDRRPVEHAGYRFTPVTAVARVR